MLRSVGVLFVGLLMVATLGTALAQELPKPQSPARLVNDFAGIFTSQQQQALEEKLTRFDETSSTQIAVVSVLDLQGLEPSDYAQRLHDQWGVGQGEKNNGILLLVKPKTRSSRGEVFISVGYGLEGVVPDITAGRVIDQEMLPAFKEGNMYKGVDQATSVLMQLTGGEFTAESYQKRSNRESTAGGLVVLAVFVLYIFLQLSGRGKGGKGGNSGNGTRGGGWIPPIIIGGGRGFGGGGFGGGGGGFGGFGGGMSGGGGGGRSW